MLIRVIIRGLYGLESSVGLQQRRVVQVEKLPEHVDLACYWREQEVATGSQH